MKNCRDCIYWDNRGVDWGYCTQIKDGSNYADANLMITGLENYGEIKYEAEVTLETKGDFGCTEFYQHPIKEK